MFERFSSDLAYSVAQISLAPARANVDPPLDTSRLIPFLAPLCSAFCPSVQVRGKPPVFVLPEPKKRIDDKIHPEVERRLQEGKAISQQTNFMRRNMQL